MVFRIIISNSSSKVFLLPHKLIKHVYPHFVTTIVEIEAIGCLIGLGLAHGSAGAINIRIKTYLSDSLVSKLTVTTYQGEFPALLVRGGNSWVTSSTRTKGYILTSPNYDSKYEGYVYFPNADGWGGDR